MVQPLPSMDQALHTLTPQHLGGRDGQGLEEKATALMLEQMETLHGWGSNTLVSKIDISVS